MNIKRGFNRLFIVLAILWAAYLLVVYPYQKRAEAFEEYQKEQQICRESPGPFGLDSCLGVMKNNYDGRLGNNSKFWWVLLAFVLVSIPAVYGFCRGAAAVSVWVWRGFKGEAPRKPAPLQDETSSVQKPSKT